MKKRIGKWIYPLTILVAVSLIFGFAGAASAAPEEKVDVIISFKGRPAAADAALVQEYGGKVTHTYNLIPAFSASIPKGKLELLRNNPRVKMIEEDRVCVQVAGQVLPWGVDRVDAEIFHPANKGTGVRVAVLDTGIDLDHPDLAVAGSVSFVPGAVSADDDNGHGTLVAGIIAALNNDIGVVGVAPEAALYSVKVLNQNGDGLMSVILSGIEWSINNQMQVINMSFGSGMEMPEAIRDAIAAAYDAGIVVVAGAGNGGNAAGTDNNIWSPARYTPVIAVGAIDAQGARWQSSSTGYQLELVAPGVDIGSTAMGGGYASITGTSASAAHLAGAAALLLASGVTDNVEVRSRLRSSAQDMGVAGWDSQYGCGLVNASAAISLNGSIDWAQPNTSISLNGTPGSFGWFLSDVVVDLSAADRASGVAGIEYSLDCAASWNTYISPFVISKEGATLVLARARDNAGNTEAPPAFATIKLDKTPSTLTETVSISQVATERKGAMLDINYRGTTADQVSGAYYPVSTALRDEYNEYSQDLGPYLWGTVSIEANCDPRDGDGRLYTIELTARDIAGNEASAFATITVLPRTLKVEQIKSAGHAKK